MKSVLLALGLVVAAAGLSSCNAYPSGPSGNASLAGAVTDVVTGGPVAGVTLAVQSKTATTGSDGHYSISGLASGQATLTAQHQGHVNFSQNVTLSGTTTVNVPLTPSVAAEVAGNWTGNWLNATFGSTGTITMAVAVDTIAQTVQVVLHVNGPVFGGPNPPAETFNGAYATTGTTLTRTSTVFGTVTVTVTPTGQITGSVVNVPVSTIARLDFSGTISATTLTINYTVTFTNGTTATGLATLVLPAGVHAHSVR